ncbi:MAG: polysaccharide deacetylase family protein [Candidatus Thiodiazotropha taylori]|nr:polysaccharide deacetylase family protein [Candidatus Thiodiazotropha taylori]MCW4316701.1 polysaccharide deacetylase family protein [Candidatus Thiodiazotropha taylori]
MSIEPDEFGLFIEALSASGTLVPLSEVLNQPERDTTRCAITIDDCYADLQGYAFPVLREFQAPATVFLPTYYVANGRPFWWEILSWLEQQPDELSRLAQLWDWPMAEAMANTIDHWCAIFKAQPPKLRQKQLEEVRLPAGVPTAMSKDALKDIPENIRLESHGHTHTVLTALTRQQVKEEIELSSYLLESWTGRRPKFFAYPNGQPSDFSEEHVGLFREAGISHALTTVEGRVPEKYEPYAVPRIGVKPGRALQQLEELLSI